jgi:hypothetical protein
MTYKLFDVHLTPIKHPSTADLFALILKYSYFGFCEVVG